MGWLQFLAGLFLWVTLLFHVFTGFSASLLIKSHQKLYSCRRYHFHKENALDLSVNLPHKTQCLEALQCLPWSILWNLEEGQSSHAVHNVAGSLAHIPDLAAETGAHGHARPCPAVWHRAHQLPPTGEKKKKFLPFLSNLKVFSVPEILFRCLAVHSAQKCTPFSAKSEWNKQKNVDCYLMKEWQQGIERSRGEGRGA